MSFETLVDLQARYLARRLRITIERAKLIAELALVTTLSAADLASCGSRTSLEVRLEAFCIGLVTETTGALSQHSAAPTHDSASANAAWVSGSNLVQPPDLPEIGKWMLAGDGSAAHWLGEVYQGKRLREPINVIIVDENADSEDRAKLRLIRAAASAGYPIRMGHSSGYQGHLGGQLYAQIPSGWDDAFSDEPFEFSNNHGRVFGPHKSDYGYVMIGAFSREEVVPFRWPGHRYASFNQARDDFARRLDRTSDYKLVGYVSLENAISDAEVTTGDHDGKAVLVRKER